MDVSIATVIAAAIAALFSIVSVIINLLVSPKLFTYQTRFSAYHEKQVEVITQLYGLLYDASIALHDLKWVEDIKGVQTQELSKKAFEAVMAFARYFGRNRLYLDENVCEQAKHLIDSLQDQYMSYDFARRDPPRWMTEKLKAKADNKLAEVEGKVPPAMKALEDQLRKVISP